MNLFGNNTGTFGQVGGSNTINLINQQAERRNRDGHIISSITAMDPQTSLEELRMNDYFALKRNEVPEGTLQIIEGLRQANRFKRDATPAPAHRAQTVQTYTNAGAQQQQGNVAGGGGGLFGQRNNQPAGGGGLFGGGGAAAAAQNNPPTGGSRLFGGGAQNNPHTGGGGGGLFAGSGAQNNSPNRGGGGGLFGGGGTKPPSLFGNQPNPPAGATGGGGLFGGSPNRTGTGTGVGTGMFGNSPNRGTGIAAGTATGVVTGTGTGIGVAHPTGGLFNTQKPVPATNSGGLFATQTQPAADVGGNSLFANAPNPNNAHNTAGGATGGLFANLSNTQQPPVKSGGLFAGPSSNNQPASGALPTLGSLPGKPVATGTTAGGLFGGSPNKATTGGLFASAGSNQSPTQPKAAATGLFASAKTDNAATTPKKDEEEEKKEAATPQTQTQDEEQKKEESPAKQPADHDNEKTATEEAKREEQKLPEPVQPVKASSLFAKTEESKQQTSLFSSKPAQNETNNTTGDVQPGKVLEANPRTVNSAEGSFHHEANKMLFVSGLVGLFKDHNMGFTNNVLDNTDFVPKMFEFFKEYGVVPLTKNVPQFSVKTGQVQSQPQSQSQSPEKAETVTAVTAAATTGETTDPREEEKVPEQITVSPDKPEVAETKQEEIVRPVVQDQSESQGQAGEQDANVNPEEPPKKETDS